MDTCTLTIKTVRDGPTCTLVLCGDLEFLQTGRFLDRAALAVDDFTERSGFDLAGVLSLDCAGVRALRIATHSAPGGCRVIISSFTPMSRRIVELLGLDLANLRELSLGHGLRDGSQDGRTDQQDFVPVGLGAPFLAGTEVCP